MRRHILWLLLALSVLFNVFFLAGYSNARAQLTEAEADATTQGVATALALDESQRAVFEQLRAGMDDDNRAMRDALALTRQDLIDELENDEPDLEKVRATVQQIGTLQQRHRAVSLERFSTFMSCLTDDQCRELGRRMGKRRDHMRRRLLERFDRDGNGELDPDERAEAQAFHESRRREIEAQRQRFDADGDGRLDPGERKAFREWMEQNGMGGPRRGRGRPESPPPGH